MTKEQRIEFFKQVKPKDDFNYKFLGNFEIEAQILLDYLQSENYRDEYIELGEYYQPVLGESKIHTILDTTNRHQCLEPYDIKYVTSDKKLIELCKPILSRLEEIYNGKASTCSLHILPANKSIPLHSDSRRPAKTGKLALSYYLNLSHRVHIPLITNDKVIFEVQGEAKNMKFGEAWEANTDVEHEVINGSNFDRLHLLANILPNRWL